MKLRYNILWFEDEEEVVEEDVGKGIKTFLQDLGFEPVIRHEKDGIKLDELLQKNSYDLIVSDLNLGREETGDKLIDYIRNQSIYTEVLLYSAATSDINNIIERNGRMIERVSFAVGLGELPRKLKSIISITVKKVQDVNNMRGLVIAETVDLEIVIEDTVKKYFEIFPAESIDKFRQELFDDICEEKKTKCQQNLSFAEQMNSMNICKLIDDDILTFYDLYEALQSILKKHIKILNLELNSVGIASERREILDEQKYQLNLLKAELCKFNNDIILRRNTLAHVQEKVNEKGVPYLQSLNKAGVEIIFDEEKYSEIRKDLRRHSTNLSRIKDYIYTIESSQKEVAAANEFQYDL